MLEENRWWLFVVDDATSENETLSRFILVNVPHGRVIMTSKEHLDQVVGHQTAAIQTTLTMRLEPLSTTSCFTIWKNMRLFPVSRGELDRMSENTNIEADLKRRCNLTKKNPPLMAIAYIPPKSGETEQETRQRHREIESSLREYEGLSTPGLEKFFSESLGNLPVSVRLVGNMLLRSGGKCMYACMFVREHA